MMHDIGLTLLLLLLYGGAAAAFLGFYLINRN